MQLAILRSLRAPAGTSAGAAQRLSRSLGTAPAASRQSRAQGDQPRGDLPATSSRQSRSLSPVGTPYRMGSLFRCVRRRMEASGSRQRPSPPGR
jgi:hypothetical protein